MKKQLNPKRSLKKQIHVACSRVQTGTGLHLADFYPEKICVNIPSLMVLYIKF